MSIPCRRSDWLQPLLDWLPRQPGTDWLLVIDKASDDFLSLLSEMLIPVRSFNNFHTDPYLQPRISIITGQLCSDENFPLTIVSLDRGLQSGEEDTKTFHSIFPEVDVVDEDTSNLLEILWGAPLSILCAGADDSNTHMKAGEQTLSFCFSTAPQLNGFSRQDLSQDDRTVGHQETPWIRLAFSLNQVRVERPRAVEILYLMSVLVESSVLMTLLLRDDENIRTFHGAIQRLLKYFLVYVSDDGQYLVMPKSIGTYIQNHLREQNVLSIWQKKAVKLLMKRFPQDEASYWRGREALLPQIKQVLTFETTDKESKLDRASLLRKIASYHTDRGFHQQAHSEYDEAFNIYKAEYGEKHEVTLETAQKCASSLFYNGNYDAAHTMMLQNAKIQEQLFEEGHPDRLRSLNSLALVLEKQGKFKEAMIMFSKAIDANMKIHTEAHVDTFIMKSNLASLLKDTGDYDMAKSEYEEVLEGRRALLGPSNPATIESISALAGVFTAQGEYSKAAEMNKNALALAEPVLGQEHPTTIGIENNLAVGLSNLGKYAEAVLLHRRVLETRLKQNREDHPDVISSRLNLGTVLEKQREYDLAAVELTVALSPAICTLGPESPMTLQIRNSLGLVRLRQGKFALAEEMFRSSLESTINLYTENTIETLRIRNNLAGALQRQGKLLEAEKLNRGTMATAFKLLGPKHPFTLRTRNNAAEVLRELAQFTDTSETKQGQYLTEALELHKYALAGREEVLPPNHPDISISRSNVERIKKMLESPT